MEEDKFNFLTEQFDDIKILRYQVPAFGQLPLREKIFVYYLSQAALTGRDILWDQNNRYNLRIRKILERIVWEYPGDRYRCGHDDRNGARTRKLRQGGSRIHP